MKSLERSLSLLPATAIVIGSVVGSGIFVSSAEMARLLGSAKLLLLVWSIAGFMTFLGILTLAELSAQMPYSGGLYDYFKRIYGRPVGFLYGWANFAIAGSGGIAAIAYICASFTGEWLSLPHFSANLEKWQLTIPYVGTLYPLADIGVKLLGSGIVVFLTWINIRGIRLGAMVQSISTSAKLVAIVMVIATAFFIHPSGAPALPFLMHFSGGSSASLNWKLIGAMGLAMSGAFWSYDGWGNIAYVAEEVKEPEKNVPRSMFLGALCFVSLYLIINMAYLYVMPIEAIGAAPSDRVASAMMKILLGSKGVLLISALIILSSFDTTNSTLLTNARVYFAMARDHLFWKHAADVHSRFRTPHIALIYQCIWTVVLIMSGSFELIASMYVFINWLLYALMGLGLFIHRYKQNKGGIATPIHMRFLGANYLPALFMIFAFAYVIVTLVADVQLYHAGGEPMIKSVMGLLLVSTGLPFFWMWKKKPLTATYNN